MVRHWYRLSEKVWVSPPWQCSRPGWMGLWATWSTGRCPCPWQGGWNKMIFKNSFQPKPFYDSMILHLRLVKSRF